MADAAAVVAGESLRYLLACGMGIVIEQSAGCHDDAGSAVAALESVLINERLLDGVKLVCHGVLKTFDRGDLGTVALNGKSDAGCNSISVYYNGAAAAGALGAGLFSACQVKAVAKGLAQSFACGNLTKLMTDGKYISSAVYGHGNSFVCHTSNSFQIKNVKRRRQ